MTYATKINHKTREMIRPAESEEDKSDEDDVIGGDKAVAVKEDPQFVIAVTRGGAAIPFGHYHSSKNDMLKESSFHCHCRQACGERVTGGIHQQEERDVPSPGL